MKRLFALYRRCLGATALLFMATLLSGCEEINNPCWDDDGGYIHFQGASHPNARPLVYEGGPTTWGFSCSPESRDLDRFRFALTLGDGIRTWIEPEPGTSVNGRPIPTYRYTFGSGVILRNDTTKEMREGDPDLLLGFYNWGYGDLDPQDPKGACREKYDDYYDRRSVDCRLPFLAIWNGTDANMSRHDPLPSGRYTVEVYLKDPADPQATIAVNDIRPDGRTIDWMSCKEAPALDEERACNGTLEVAEVLSGHPWPEPDGNRK